MGVGCGEDERGRLVVREAARRFEIHIVDRVMTEKIPHLIV